MAVLDRELVTDVGDIDLYAMDRNKNLVAVELKRAKATQDAVHQLSRYVDAVRRRVSQPVRGIIAAPAISSPAAFELERLGLEFVEIHALPVARDEERQASLFG